MEGFYCFTLFIFTFFPPQAPKPAKECKNSGQYSVARCKGWISLCSRTSQWYGFMKDHCSETCGFCKKEGKDIPFLLDMKGVKVISEGDQICDQICTCVEKGKNKDLFKERESVCPTSFVKI